MWIRDSGRADQQEAIIGQHLPELVQRRALRLAVEIDQQVAAEGDSVSLVAGLGRGGKHIADAEADVPANDVMRPETAVAGLEIAVAKGNVCLL